MSNSLFAVSYVRAHTRNSHSLDWRIFVFYSRRFGISVNNVSIMALSDSTLENFNIPEDARNEHIVFASFRNERKETESD